MQFMCMWRKNYKWAMRCGQAGGFLYFLDEEIFYEIERTKQIMFEGAKLVTSLNEFGLG